MSVETEEELEALRAAGAVVAGRRIHEPPHVPNYYVPRLSQPLTDGLVLTIEPIISAGSGAVCACDDGWTMRTADGAISAHAEHTIVVTKGAPVVLPA